MKNSPNIKRQIGKSVFTYNLWVVVLLLLVLGAAYLLLNQSMATVITGIVSMVVGSLIQERQTLINYHYGADESRDTTPQHSHNTLTDD